MCEVIQLLYSNDQYPFNGHGFCPSINNEKLLSEMVTTHTDIVSVWCIK